MGYFRRVLYTLYLKSFEGHDDFYKIKLNHVPTINSDSFSHLVFDAAGMLHA